MHSKLPWSITPKAPYQIVDADEKTVAKLTSMDMENAKLIVDSVNHMYNMQNTTIGKDNERQ